MDPLTLPPVDEDRLLAFLRRRLGCPAVTFLEPPTPLASGGEAVVDAFRIAGLDDPQAGWSGPLVLRRLLPLKDAEQLRWEAAVHGALQGQGFPVPRVLAVETDARLLGAPFLVAERIAGQVLLQEVTRPASLARRPQRFPRLIFQALFRVPALLAATQVRLHRVDPAPLRERLATDGLSADDIRFAARLERVRRRVEAAGLEGLRPGLAWLDGNRPRAAGSVVCHGDLVFTNLCVAHGRVTGVFDWSAVTLAEPAYDVAASLARLRSNVPGMPAAVDWISRRSQAGMARRYLAAYRHEIPLESERLRYYEAYWLLSELAWSGERLAAGAVHDDAIEHRWLHPETITAGVADFRRRTGVELAPRWPA